MMIWLIMGLVFALDQLTKYYISHTFNYLQSIPIIPEFFHFTYVQNYGAAFGILQNRRPVFIFVSVLVIGFLIYFYNQLPKDWISKVALGMAIGGMLGNLLDRIRLGYVIDFLDFRFWPVFNVADSAIVLGMIFLAWKILITEKKNGEVENV